MIWMIRFFVLLGVLSSISLSQGSLLLVGGGAEDYNDWSDAPYRWLVTHAPNARILVLHYSDTTNFFSGYFPWLSPCTVSNLAITSSSQANDSAVYRRILEHDGIFMRGGDQWQYVNTWRGTLAEKAIREVYARGGAVGGTSAGEAILSEIVFDAHFTSVAPRIALRNPLGASITLTDDFLRLGTGYIADSHFFERGRLGRLPAFLAVYKQLKQREITGVGVDANTALAVGPDGVGEAMGSGTVTIVRYTPRTQTALASGEQLSMTNLDFDQLTVGAKIAFTTGEVYPSSSASAYAATAFSVRTSMVILDGSNSSSDWFGTSGSLRKLQNALVMPMDTVGIIASPSTPTSAFAVQSALAAWGTPARLLWINESTKDDPGVAAAIRACQGFVFAGNSPDSVARFLDSATQIGIAFGERVDAHVPMLFLSDDVMLVGEQGIGQMYRSIYGAYYGYLTQVKGLGIVRGMQCVPRLYEDSDYIDNRASAVFWSMVKLHLPFGLFLDTGTHVVIAEGRLRVYGATPVLLIDARTAQWGSLPEFRDPGKVNPRQNGGIIGATLHVVRDGGVFDLNNTTGVQREPVHGSVPDHFELLQNFPNPFNPVTTIGFRLPAGQAGVAGFGLQNPGPGTQDPVSNTRNPQPGSLLVRLVVYDLLGREVAVLVDERKPAGEYTVQFNAAGLSSGVYYCRMTSEGFAQTRKLVVVR